MPTSDAFDERLLESLPLPEGVTPQQWAEEKAQRQNPLIRALLGCSGLLDTVHESNQAILNCSPDRLAEIWTAVRQVANLLVEEILPLLDSPSVVPRLEEARERTRMAGAVLASTVVEEIERMPAKVDEARSKELRKLLCVSLGQLHDYLQDAFSDLMANDPRSFHDSGYFLSRRFRRDVEEAEWLLSTVDTLAQRLETFEARRQRDLATLVAGISGAATMPSADALAATARLLEDLVRELTPRLKEAVALRGIRFAELEVVDRWASELPASCHVVLELFALTARALGATTERRRGGDAWERALVERVHELLYDLDGLLKDLRAFLPLWRQGISNRRALAFRRLEGSESGARADSR